MLAEHIVPSMLLHGWLTGPRPYQVPDGHPWQRADQWQEKAVLDMNLPASPTYQTEMHDEKSEALVL